MQALQGLCGVGMPLTSTVRQLWMAVVAQSGILTTEFARYARHQALPRACSLSGHEEMLHCQSGLSGADRFSPERRLHRYTYMSSFL